MNRQTACGVDCRKLLVDTLEVAIGARRVDGRARDTRRAAPAARRRRGPHPVEGRRRTASGTLAALPWSARAIRRSSIENAAWFSKNVQIFERADHPAGKRHVDQAAAMRVINLDPRSRAISSSDSLERRASRSAAARKSRSVDPPWPPASRMTNWRIGRGKDWVKRTPACSNKM